MMARLIEVTLRIVIKAFYTCGRFGLRAASTARYTRPVQSNPKEAYAQEPSFASYRSHSNRNSPGRTSFGFACCALAAAASRGSGFQSGLHGHADAAESFLPRSRSGAPAPSRSDSRSASRRPAVRLDRAL